MDQNGRAIRRSDPPKNRVVSDEEKLRRLVPLQATPAQEEARMAPIRAAAQAYAEEAAFQARMRAQVAQEASPDDKPSLLQRALSGAADVITYLPRKAGEFARDTADVVLREAFGANKPRGSVSPEQLELARMGHPDLHPQERLSKAKESLAEHGAYGTQIATEQVAAGVQAKAAAVVLSAAPSRGVLEQGRDPLGRFLTKGADELAPGADRALRVQRKLQGRFGEKAVQAEQYLRRADGSIVIDEVTGTGRRLDYVVIKEGKARYSVEVTSKTASKGGQLAKERRIRQQGGTFVLDRTTGELVDVSDVPTRLIRVR